MDEVLRIKEAYARREGDEQKKLYSLFNTPELFIQQQRERSIITSLKRNGMSDISGKKILDLGCNAGKVLRSFIKYGAAPNNLYGIDLLPGKIKAAREISPNINFECGNAEKLPYENGSFDIILLFTVFTSIFDPDMKKNIALELLRVLKNGGSVLFYDFRYNNPRNPDVKKITKTEVISLFPDCVYDFELTTLAPPITRALVPYSWLLCCALEKVPILKTHYLVMIKKHGKKV